MNKPISPKQKALNIIKDFFPIVHHEAQWDNEQWDKAKECATYYVDNILIDFVLQHDNERAFWEQVKDFVREIKMPKTLKKD